MQYPADPAMVEEKAPRREMIALSVVIGLVLLFSYEMILASKIPFFRDLPIYFYPMRFSLAEGFKIGELPLWDRHTAMGFPLLANFQSAVFYPPHLFFLILPFFDALRLLFILHYLVAATGSYWLCRQWNYPRYLAILGATLFTLGGTVVSLTNLLNHFQTAVWLPWVILSGERWLRIQSRKNFLLFTFVLLFQFLAGSPEVYLMSLGLLFCDGLRFKADGSKGAQSRLLFLLAANALVAGLAMVQILPTIELLLESREQTRIVYEEASALALHPLSLINLFFMDKEIDPIQFRLPQLFLIPSLSLLLTHYMGALSLMGVSLWPFYASKKEKVLVLALIAASLVVAMGDYTPVYSFLFRHLHFFSLLRFPEKFFFLTNALLLFVTLRGLFCFLQFDHSSPGRPMLILSSICFLFLALYLSLRLHPEPLIRFIAWASPTPLLSPETLGRTSAVLVHLERQLALTLGFLLLFFLYKRGKFSASLLSALLIALVFFDLKSAHGPYQYLLSPDLVYKNSRIIAVPDSEPSRLFYYPHKADLHPAYYPLLKQPSFAEFSSLLFSNLLPNTGIFHGFDYMQEIDALARGPYMSFLSVANRLPPERQYRLLGSLNVKHISSLQPLSEQGITLIRHFPEHPSWLYRANYVVPRSYIVSSVRVEKEPAKILERLSSAEFDPLKEVILERPLSIPLRKGFKGQAEIARYANQEVTIRASLNGPGVLVLADSFYPGWRAYVDGQEREILRANFFFRGVLLEAGEHSVEFRYRPLSFRIGLIVSLMTLGGVTFGSILLALSHRGRA